ncbi:MAG: F0F1 ATP synthase subunit gamma [Gammaproteobacteria bacterium]|jgi:F-type H+-transporting ATPase subunit gamma|nr:F0F1 ATP synthase subunit gamma [Gammaproteobacteria bacterium]MDH3886955.1 F0F1 ATP synthase subunit gamma [Gammaproteobacteria bacterium]MDH3934101.1 F0F1 ATP synthase subunit gamma [Gammaproteobacteria bacterium]
MAGAKEIRTQVASIKNTQKITKAMQMVAASKMRKAQERMLATRPYADKIQNVVAHLSHAHPEYHHPYLIERETKRVGLIVISTDRGLCGGLNTNLFKAVITAMKEWDAAGLDIDLTLLGTKSNAFFKHIGGNITASATHLGDAPSIVELIGTVKVMLDAYAAGSIDRLCLAHNVFENTMIQNPLIKQLIPIVDEADEQLKTHWDYIYEPDSKPVMDALMIRYIESLVYQGVVENVACEQAARMVAMKSATENANDLIDELQLIYNKARQAAITQEISEIVSGAAAV